MRLFSVSNWLKTPNDRDIIARWTVPTDADAPPEGAHVLELAPPTLPTPGAEWEFLAVGDTGDAEASGPEDAPQDAVGREMARDAAAPVGPGAGRLLLHTGDVIYMTGERRLYDRNFRRPYAPFLTDKSTVDDLIFRLPFLPVPGNHDYYDLGSWAAWLTRIPILGRGLRALAHELFAFGIPEGGSDMGRAYMEAFVAPKGAADGSAAATPLPYAPGERTRVPNRYYQFQTGGADFFALDSNTLDAPAPEDVDEAQVRKDAADRVAALEKRSEAVDAALRRAQRERDEQQAALRRQIGMDPARRDELGAQSEGLAARLAELRATLESVAAAHARNGSRRLAGIVQVAERRWAEGAADLRAAPRTEDAETALKELDDASDEVCAALGAVEFLLVDLEKGDPLREELLSRTDSVDRLQTEWAKATGLNTNLDERIHALSEEALDVQRDLALAKRRQRYRPEDHDRAQLAWLDAALTASERDRPDAWRIVYLHHPLYTTVSNRCERPDVQGVRALLLPILKRHDVHVVLAGHAHAFEWVRSSELPNTGLFVTGGGGQISLRPSMFEPRRFGRMRGYYDSLRRAGAQECVMAGHGPFGDDGEVGLLYHYLRVSVTPDALTFRPVGVRRLADGSYRREEPMPVFHAPYLPESRPRWETGKLAGVVVRRGAPPRPEWA